MLKRINWQNVTSLVALLVALVASYRTYVVNGVDVAFQLEQQAGAITTLDRRTTQLEDKLAKLTDCSARLEEAVASIKITLSRVEDLLWQLHSRAASNDRRRGAIENTGTILDSLGGG